MENYENDYFIGNPAAQMDDWIYQNQPDNCAVAAELSIIQQFVGNEMSLDEASYISASNGWYDPGFGTSPDEIGNLMDLHGIPNHSVIGATPEQLIMELDQGNAVIVGVNADELWDQGILNDIKQFFLDAFGLDNANPANHAVTITGVDLSDPSQPMVIINDSGTPNGAAVKYPLDQFVDAWENSGFYYTATDVPIPNSPYPSPTSLGFDLGDLLGLATTIITGDMLTGDLVNMGTDYLSDVDWESVLEAI
jgi:hypothetical protein